MDFKPKKIVSGMDVYNLEKEGFLIKGKSKFKTNKGIMRYIFLQRKMNHLYVVVEDIFRNSFVLGQKELRDLECQTTEPDKIEYSPWEDPA